MTGRRGILVAWFALLGIVAFGLQALGDGALAAPPLHPAHAATWLAGRDPLIATVAVLRVGVVVLCWYLVAATVTGILARWFRADRAVVVLDRVTIPLVRRLVQQTAGMSMALVVAAAPTAALASSPAASAGVERTVGSAVVPLDLLPARGAPAASVPPTGDHLLLPWQVGTGAGGVGVVPEEPGAAADPPPGATGGFHLVRSGDSLWRIAREHLEATLGETPSDDEVAPYWQRLTDVNRDRLIDPHDPDLILPGQQLLVPPVVAP